MMNDLEFHAMLQRGLCDHVSMCQRIYSSKEVCSCIQQAALIILHSMQSGGALYLCGNGGSAADSQHIATEFVSRFYKERRALNAEALTVNTSSLTAIGNDYCFDQVFVRQMEAKGKAGDVLMGITTSGSSPNVINALDHAAKNGIHTILLTSNRYANHDETVYECIIRMPSVDVARVQEGHIFVGHVLAEYVETQIGQMSGERR